LTPSNTLEIKKALISSVIFFTCPALIQAQTAIGFNEGLLGNSGTAISNTTAASVFNPSLLLQKTKNSYSLGGNSFANFSSDSDNGKWSSAKLMPNYISSLQAFDSFVHEFFIATLYSIDAQISYREGDINNNFNIQGENYFAGYSFAFRGLPLGFQIGLRSNETRSVGEQEYEDFNEVRTGFIRGNNRYLNLVVGIGGSHQMGGYTLGYRFLSRGISIVKKQKATGIVHIYNKNSNQYSRTEQEIDLDNLPTDRAQMIVVGHGFLTGENEFLTDTRLEEEDTLTHTYKWYQTFGYRYNPSGKYQFMCGIMHLIEKDVKYFGQAVYLSAGFSWLNNTNRSGLGAFYSQNKVKEVSQIYGVTFNSEFVY